MASGFRATGIKRTAFVEIVGELGMAISSAIRIRAILRACLDLGYVISDGFPIPGVIYHLRKVLPDGRESHVRIYDDGTYDDHIDPIPYLRNRVVHTVAVGLPATTIFGTLALASDMKPKEKLAVTGVGLLVDFVRALVA